MQGKQYIVRWHPFQLNPSASQEGIEKLDFYNTKFGKERTQQMVPFMRVSPSTPQAHWQGSYPQTAGCA